MVTENFVIITAYHSNFLSHQLESKACLHDNDKSVEQQNCRVVRKGVIPMYNRIAWGQFKHPLMADGRRW
jgi:hypothetical protein